MNAEGPDTLPADDSDGLSAQDTGEVKEKGPAPLSVAHEETTTLTSMKGHQNLFRELIELSIDAIFVVNPATGRLLDVNASACRALGYTRKELLELTVLDITSGVDPALFSTTKARIHNSGSATVEALHRRKDGTTYPVEVSLSPATLDQEYLLAIVRDISERKRIEESHDWLAMAVQQAGETIVITDTQGTILYANPAFEKTTGYTCAEVLGRNPRILKSDKQDASYYRQMWEVLNRGEVWHGHFINKRKDGTLFEEEATISPLRDATGKTVSYVAVKRDVTREKELEAQFRQAQKMESVGQLSGGIAHDFNNILAVILMQAELACRGRTTQERMRRAFVGIRAAAERAANLTRQLLLFSRRQVMQPCQLNLNEVVTSLAKMLQRLIGEDVKLRLSLHPGPLPTFADAGMLDQVLMNLAVNARDAMPKGGRLMIETSRGIIDAEQAAQDPEASPGPWVCLSVSDTGCGIPPEVQARIFEPFFTTKEAGKGTGLGLATVFGIVKQHHGWLKVHSEIGQGTTFHVFLPASDNPTGDVLAKEAEHPKPCGGFETILIAEDDPAVRMLTRAVLETNGYQVSDAEDGAKAQEIWREHHGRVALLLTDLVMPGMDGLELAAILQRQAPGLKVIFTSGYSAEIAGRDLKLGAGQYFLQKPFQPHHLLTMVRNALDS